MKKTLVAIAALAATGAFAQSSVTMYGIMDVGPNVVKTTDSGTTTKVTGANTLGAWASNRLGFKGAEDLGGGYKAEFVYELGLAAGTVGALTTSAARDSNVTLRTPSAGSINFGYAKNPITFVSITLDPGSANNLAAGRSMFGKVATSRTKSLATYTLPTFVKGLTANVASGNSTTDTAGALTGDKVTGASLNYSNGPLTVAYGMNKVDKVNATGDRDESIYGATYKIGAATLLASMGDLKTKDANGAQATKKSVTQLGVKYTMGKVDSFLAYGTADDSTTAGSAKVETKYTQFGAMYNLSKRTGAYAMYGEDKTSSTGYKKSELAVGIRHSF